MERWLRTSGCWSPEELLNASLDPESMFSLIYNISTEDVVERFVKRRRGLHERRELRPIEKVRADRARRGRIHGREVGSDVTL